MNELAARTLTRGHEVFDLLHAYCILPIEHYGLDVGKLQPGDPADFIIVADPETMFVLQTWIDGKCVFEKNQVLIPREEIKPINNFVSYQVEPGDFKAEAGRDKHPVIVAQDGQIVTEKEWTTLPEENGEILADPSRDILKIAVVNRYQKAKPAVGFIRNFGIKDGAIASSVAHDSHNIIAIGSSDEMISEVVNLVMDHKGGIAAVRPGEQEILPLPVAGIMSDRPGEEVAAAYEKLSFMARDMGSKLQAPFMLISFMALLVIPSLKISDKGMFDGEAFEFV
jgi:adenine deaminase